MPALLLIELPGPRWLPALPVPLFLLWPLLLIVRGAARIRERNHPVDAAMVRGFLQMLRDLRGLEIDVNTPGRRPVRIRLV